MSLPTPRDVAFAIARPPVRAARTLRDRSLHPFRRYRAEALVRSGPSPRSILFLCTGNICRSPYAEKAFVREWTSTSTPIEAVSGGFLESGRPSPPEAVRIARERGIELEAHRSRQVDPEMLENADLVVVMENRHRRNTLDMLAGRPGRILMLGDLDPETPDRREIKDPWGNPDDVYVASFERTERCVSRLVRLLTDALRDS